MIGEDKLGIAIRDTGIGMSREEIGGVFDAFSQGSHHFGGLGLGLAISRALVELHGGTISAQSAGKGKGATFSVELPLRETAAKGEAPRSNPATRMSATRENGAPDVHVLLVEDHEPTRTALTHLLERRHFQVAGAGSVAEARLLVENEKTKFQLVISDIGLPDGNGYDLMRELKKDSALKGIALTGYGMEEDVTRSQEAGLTTHLTKPIRIETLDHALAAALKD